MMADVVAKFTLNNDDNLNTSFDLSENNFDAVFKIDAAGTTWGSIDGTLSNQTDLQTALNLKADKSTVEADFEALNDTITENYDTLDSKIDSVQSDLSWDISALSETVTNNNTAINNRVDDIVDSFDTDIEVINTAISNLETTVSNNYTTLNTNIQNEATQRAENDSLLQEGINTITDNLNSEISARELTDTNLQTQITNLSGTVSSNYITLDNKIEGVNTSLQGALDTLETTVNTNTDSISTLSTTVSHLSDTVQSNYTILDTKIDTTKADLQGDINTLSGTVTSNYNDLNSAITSSASTINARIDSEVSTLETSINSEATTRENADNVLQSQIDAITAASDVVDIVGTYAALQAYNTSNLQNNDIVKVLSDESRDDETTYYRWVITEGVGAWSFIGEEGPYYTKSEADSQFVPQTRTINNKALTENINLTASDVGALSADTQIGNGTILLTQGGVQKGTFTLNQTGNATIDFDAVSGDITIDSELSTSSENPAQNKVITTALNNKQGTISDLATIRSGAEAGATALQSGDNISELNNDEGYITGISATDVTGALGYTPYNATNPNGYTSNVGTVTSVNNVEPVNGNVTLSIPEAITIDSVLSTSSENPVQNKVITSALNSKQDTLISGTSIKTINDESLLGSGNIVINPSPDTDNLTITKNSNDELQAVGVINSNAGGVLKSWSGTRAQYDAIEVKDANTLYNITDDTDVSLTILETLYPVGAIYIGTMKNCPLEALGLGAWALKARDMVLQGAGSTKSAGETVEAGLPNIEGSIESNGMLDNGVQNLIIQGALTSGQTSSSRNWAQSYGEQNAYQKVIFDASLSNSIYGNSDTVQPPAYIVNIWERIS